MQSRYQWKVWSMNAPKYTTSQCMQSERGPAPLPKSVWYFDASARTTTGRPLNDHLLIGPTVHSSLVDVLLRFWQHKVVLTTDVTRMYCVVLLSQEQGDLHRFVWREDPDQPVKDYRMSRLTFGIAASSFATNMVLKQNAINHRESHPKAYQAVLG